MKVILLCLFGFLSLFARSQSLTFTFSDYLTLPRSRNLHNISGLEYRPERQEWLLVGDRGQAHRFRNIRQLTDWVCTPDSSFETGLNLEAVRYDAPTDTYFFAVETDEESYVGYHKNRLPQVGEPFKRIPLPHPLPVKHNKGFEALALTEQYLWVAPEAGSVDEARVDNPLIHFYRYKKTGATVVFDAEFSYEIDRNVCPSEALGGISEIIAIPGDETRLLVLERCYEISTKTVMANLYEAGINESNRTIRKGKPVFSFNQRNGFQPDNVEAMAWGEDADGQKTLVIMTDDNTGKNQWMQIIYLRMSEP